MPIIDKIKSLYKSNNYYVSIKSRSAKKNKFGKNYWNIIKDPDGKIRNRLEKKEKINHQKDTEYISSYINKFSNKKILDVGCGLGYFLSSLNNKKNKLYGCEVDKYCLDYASKYGTINIGKLEEINYTKDYFDIVVCHHVIEHIKNPKNFLKKIKKILKQHGILIISTPDFGSGAANLFKDKYRLLHDKTHISLFTSDSMHRFLRDNSFSILRVDFPFFETRFFTKKNILRLFDTSKISPPFYGNFMTFFCKKNG